MLGLFTPIPVAAVVVMQVEAVGTLAVGARVAVTLGAVAVLTSVAVAADTLAELREAAGIRLSVPVQFTQAVFPIRVRRFQARAT